MYLTNRKRRIPVCFLLPHLGMRIMFYCGAIMLGLNFMYSRWLFHHIFNPETSNTEIPFITTLIVAPVTAICCLYAIYRGSHYPICLECKIKYGTPAERGFLGKLFTQEGTVQARFLGVINAGIAIVAWIYYFLIYVNVNLNLPDRFVFFIAPIAVFICSIGYMALRCIGLWNYYSNYIGTSSLKNGPYSLLRFIMIWDNYIAVTPPESDPDKITDFAQNRFDTPESIYIAARNNVSVSEAQSYLINKINFRINDVRVMYSITVGNADYNIFTYLCFLTDEEKENLLREMPNVEFITLHQLHTLINTKKCNPLFSSEIIRLYTAAMAWKTYDKNGRRKYKIKHYTPTFRLCDIHKWDVDYNDPMWFRIHLFNQDSFLYKIRRLWHKYTED
ncbi:MAG: hypothetical protein K2H84_09665, partial [Paramuribaculum sp.]|nr:hypothetical protein [Paramuribaculum sp.]